MSLLDQIISVFQLGEVTNEARNAFLVSVYSIKYYRANVPTEFPPQEAQQNLEIWPATTYLSVKM